MEEVGELSNSHRVRPRMLDPWQMSPCIPSSRDFASSGEIPPRPQPMHRLEYPSKGKPKGDSGLPRHDPPLDVPIVLQVRTLYGIALKTLRTGDIVTMAMVMAREVKVKVKGRTRGGQVGGIEDTEAAGVQYTRL